MTKPILFNADMVRSILENRKTVTRRVVKPQPKGQLVPTLSGGCWPGYFEEIGTSRVQRPPYRPGNILYVRETWQQGLGGTYLYKASAGLDLFMNKEGNLVSNIPWCPSIHMPREAARTFLRVTAVRVERLQEIDGRGVLAEGVDNGHSNPKMGQRWENMQRMTFSKVWDSCYAKPRPVRGTDGTIDHYESYPWEDIQETRTYRGKPWYVIGNPWVWVIEFERISREEALSNE